MRSREWSKSLSRFSWGIWPNSKLPALPGIKRREWFRVFLHFNCWDVATHTAVIGTMQLPPRNWYSQPEFPKTGQAERGNRTEAIRNQTRTQKKANQLRQGPPLSQAGVEKCVRSPLLPPSFPFHFVYLRGRDSPERSLNKLKLLSLTTGTGLSPLQSSRPQGPPHNPTKAQLSIQAFPPPPAS